MQIGSCLLLCLVNTRAIFLLLYEVNVVCVFTQDQSEWASLVAGPPSDVTARISAMDPYAFIDRSSSNKCVLHAVLDDDLRWDMKSRVAVCEQLMHACASNSSVISTVRIMLHEHTHTQQEIFGTCAVLLRAHMGTHY